MPFESYTLSKEQMQRYADDGYLVIRKFFEQASLDTYRQRFIDICNGLVTMKKGKYFIFKQPSLKNSGLGDEVIVNKIQNVENDEVFSTYFENPQLLDVVSQLIGDNLLLFHAMVFNKPPGSGHHYSHQDLHYFPLRPADKIIGTWTAIDNVTVDNGCLYLVPGSHRPKELYPHSKLPGADVLYHVIEEEDIRAPIEKRVNLEMGPGDVVLFHPLIVHGSGPNVSKNYRKAISSHYASCECRFVQLGGTPQEHLAKEAEAVLRRQGFGGSYTDCYRGKSRVVRGQGHDDL